MQYISIVLLVLMTTAFITCGVLLWRRRTETGDYSRTIQALFSWYPTLKTTRALRRRGALASVATKGEVYLPQRSVL